MTHPMSPEMPTPSARGPWLGRWALGFAVVAAVASVAASAAIGLTIGPMELEHGPQLTDTPPEYQVTVAALLASQVLWTVLGVTGLALGVAAIVRRAGRGLGVGAVVTATLAPVVSFVAFLVLVALTSSPS